MNSELREQLDELQPAWNSRTSWTKFELTLTVEYERSTEQPKLFLGCYGSLGEMGWEPYVTVTFGETESEDDEETFNDLIFGFLHPIHIPGTNCIALAGIGDSSYAELEDEEGLFMRTLKANGMKGLSLALHETISLTDYYQRMDRFHSLGYRGEWILRSPKLFQGRGYVPVHHNSIAGAILRNLAYAPPEQRLDNLLIEDATRKIADMNKFIETEREKYLEAISRLGEE